MTGPKTPYGKSRSRANAVKHGLRATDELFVAHLSEKESAVFTELRSSLHREYKPKTTQEKLLVDQIVIQNFRLYRIYDLEYLATNRSFEQPLRRESIIPHLDRFSRYDFRVTRQLRMLHNRLKSLYFKREDYSLTAFPARE